MIATLKALAVILPVIIATFMVARFVFRDIIKPLRIDVWAVLFCIVTVVGFLVANFWLMIIALACFTVLITGLKVEKNHAALYALLICALPPHEQAIPGFAGINQLFPISPPLLLSMSVLLPALFYTRRIMGKSWGIHTTDAFVFGYVFLSVILAFRDTSFTDGLRGIWIVLLTVFLPYFIFSRWARTMDEIKVITIALVVPLLALSAIAFLETLMNWHFYAMPSFNWHGVGASPYFYRSGFLRVYASVMGPIEFGFLVMVAMTFSYALIGQKQVNNLLGMFGLGGMAGALLLTFSRGPWMGAVISTATYVVSGPKGLGRGFIAGIAAIVLFAALAVSPIGNSVLSILPFIDSSDGNIETISYRQKLLENGTQVIMLNPLFGSTTFMEHPKMQELVQGQGIIDLVNTYIQIALAKGLVGLFLFTGILFSAAFAAWRAMRLMVRTDPQQAAFARAFFAAMIGIIAVIATTSSIAQVPIFYWMLAGLCVAMRRIVEEQRFTQKLPQAAEVAVQEAPQEAIGGMIAPAAGAAPSPALSMRAAKDQQDQKIDAEAAALAQRNAEKKQAAQRRALPAHLRQYAPKNPSEG